jgi:adenylate cyclase
MVQDYDAANAEFEKALELNPESYEALYFFGRSKIHEGDLERARDLFERAAEIRPEDYQSVLLLPQLYHSLGDPEREMEAARQGIERARAVLELNPDDNRALNMSAFALLRLGRKDEAIRHMEESVRKAPMDSIVHYNAACLYALAGDPEKSIDCLENCRFRVGNLNREWLMHDSDLDSVRGHPRFAEILNSFAD